MFSWKNTGSIPLSDKNLERTQSEKFIIQKAEKFLLIYCYYCSIIVCIFCLNNASQNFVKTTQIFMQ
jgi:hypothetical protein